MQNEAKSCIWYFPAPDIGCSLVKALGDTKYFCSCVLRVHQHLQYTRRNLLSGFFPTPIYCSEINQKQSSGWVSCGPFKVACSSQSESRSLPNLTSGRNPLGFIKYGIKYYLKNYLRAMFLNAKLGFSPAQGHAQTTMALPSLRQQDEQRLAMGD